MSRHGPSCAEHRSSRKAAALDGGCGSTVTSVEPKALEVWGRAVVERAAEEILAAIPREQHPETGPTGRAISARPGYVSRYVHFRRPDYPAQRAIWLFVVPPNHPYNIGGPEPRAGAGLMQDPDTELDESRFAAGLVRSGAFTWRRHNNPEYAGYRLVIDVAPDTDSPETVASELAAAVLHGLRRAGLIR
jgi:hypothetical protein